MSQIIGAGLMVLGFIAFLIGAVLLYFDVKGQGEIETQMGYFRGPVWFIFMIFGIVTMIVGWMMPF